MEDGVVSVGGGREAEGRMLGLGGEEGRGVGGDVGAAAMVACESFFVAAILSAFEIGGAREEGAHGGGESWGPGDKLFLEGWMVVLMMF